MMRLSPRANALRELLLLALALTGAALYAVYAAWRFAGEKLTNQYLYVVPIVAPFVAFLCDRANRRRQATVLQLTLDLLVVGTAMWRVIGNVPYISGHALFLTYCLLSTKTRVAQITAALILLETLYLKLFVWHDVVTPTSGLVLGLAAALIVRRDDRERDAQPTLKDKQ